MDTKSQFVWGGRVIAEGWKADALMGLIIALIWASGIVTGFLIGGAA